MFLIFLLASSLFKSFCYSAGLKTIHWRLYGLCWSYWGANTGTFQQVYTHFCSLIYSVDKSLSVLTKVSNWSWVLYPWFYRVVETFSVMPLSQVSKQMRTTAWMCFSDIVLTISGNDKIFISFRFEISFLTE